MPGKLKKAPADSKPPRKAQAQPGPPEAPPTTPSPPEKPPEKPPVEPGKATEHREAIEAGGGRRLNAEQVTSMATDFLKGLGNQRTTPTKVSVEGESLCMVEVELKDKVATVLIDADAREIREYEINRAAKKPSLPFPTSLTKRLLLLICSIDVILYLALSLLKAYLPLPLPFP